MDQIYKNAWVTLAATSASSCDEGFLKHLLKDERAIIPLGPRPQLQQDQERSFPVEIVIQCVDKEYGDSWEEEVDMSVWNSRGWTLQERYLSQRIIHFCKSQVFWECRQEHQSECGQQILILPIRGIQSLKMNRTAQVEDSEPESAEPEHLDDPEIAEQGSEGDDEDESSSQGGASILSNHYIAQLIYDWWFKVLCQYTSRRLTFSSDKLPALSGLAAEAFREIQQIMPHEQYLAGIWKGNLAACLLWTLEYPPAASNRTSYRSPTWSWARWDSPVVPPTFDNIRDGIYVPDDEEDVIQYVSHHIEYDGDNIFGSIKSAELNLLAKKRHVSLSGFVERPIRGGSWSGGRSSFAFNMLLPGSTERVGVIALDSPIEASQINRGNLYAMQLKKQPPGLSNWESAQWGLLLSQVEAQGSHFYRLGVYILDEEHIGFFEAAVLESCILV
jgi:heterokaryon incompatibility protein (HET)